MSTDAQAVAPPVVAVVVTSDPGPWFDDCLAALAAQDYPNLAVLVIDAGSESDPTPRVANVLPSAYVRRIRAVPGFAAAANEVLSVVEGASHFLFCHDDVAPEPRAVQAMVEEAFRSNAGIVAPKLVDWDDPRRLLQVGMGADKSGAPADLVERGELDQEQHDAVRDVFVAPGGCLLVRADLFATLDGFDARMELYGEDLDLSWRAQIAGARVVVAPAARVRHREAMSSGQRRVLGTLPRDMEALRRRVRPLQLRHRLRAVLKNYSLFHLLRVLPQLVLLQLGEIAFAVVTGRAAAARDIVGAWRWNVANRGDLRRARLHVRTHRALPDGEVRRAQARGSARITAFVRGQLVPSGGRRRGRALPAPRPAAVETRNAVAVATVVLLVVGFGSRGLLTGGLPAVHQFAPFPDSPFTFLRHYVAGWHHAGLGSEAPAPFAFAVLGVAGTVLVGAMGLLQKILVLGTIPIGVVGAYRLARPVGSPRARLASLVVYSALPVPYNALARGRWGALLVYAAFPWILARLLRAAGLEPFAGDRAGRAAHRRGDAPGPASAPPGASVWAAGLGAGIMLALVAAVAPGAPAAILAAAVGLVLGGTLAGRLGAAFRALLAATVATAVAAVLLFPWSLDLLLPGSSVSGILGVPPPAARGVPLVDLLRFRTGPHGGGALGWAFLVAAALPLVIGRSWRVEWATRLWFVALVSWAAAWAGGRAWFPFALPPADLFLAGAGSALALCVALGVAAFESDLPGYRFGWRQVVSLAAFTALVLAAVPGLVGSLGGRWKAPASDFAGLLSWMPEQGPPDSFRVLWIGDPAVLPLPGWELHPGVAYATSRNGAPTALDAFPTGSPGATALIEDALLVAERGDTTKLGHLLAPMAVRYIVLPDRLAPRQRSTTAPAPRRLLAALDAQTDLRGLETDESLEIFENVAWAPLRTILPPEAVAASQRGGLASAAAVELGGSPPALSDRANAYRYEGSASRGTDVFLAETASARWKLDIAGRAADRRDAFGWANAFTAGTSGPAVLRYRTSPLRWGAVAVNAALWVLAWRGLRLAGRRR